ncbi:hypothetical protein SLA2020_172030 [Shorea laevis]
MIFQFSFLWWTDFGYVAKWENMQEIVFKQMRLQYMPIAKMFFFSLTMQCESVWRDGKIWRVSQKLKRNQVDESEPLPRSLSEFQYHC